MKRDKTATVRCSHCGELVRIDFAKDDPRCPVCGTEGRRPPPRPPAAEKTTKAAPKAVPKVAPKPATEPVIEAVPDRDAPADDAYVFTDKDHVRCRECTLQIPRDQLICVRCGVNQQTGEKVERVFRAFHKEWHGGWPPTQRLLVFLGIVGTQLLFTVLGIVFWGESAVVVSTLVLVAALAAFVLGTYESVDLERTAKGRIKLKKRWIACFVPCPWIELSLGDYEGVVMGRDQGFDGSDWILVIALFMMGGLPGLAWWIYASTQTNFLVALSKDRGYPAMPLYRGWNEQLSKEMCQTLHDIAALPIQG